MVTVTRANFPPVMAGKPVIGVLPELRGDRLGFIQRTLAQYGDAAAARIFNRWVLILNHPDFTRQVLVEQADKFHKGPLLKQNAKIILGNGLLLSEGDFHRSQRRLIQPTFHHAKVFSFGPDMVDQTKQLISTWQDGEERDIAEEMYKLTLQIVSRTLFSADVSSEAGQISHAIEKGMRFVVNNLTPPLPLWIPTKNNRARAEVAHTMDRALYSIIRQRRESGKAYDDFLSMLIQAAEEDGSGRMTNQQVKDEALTLFLAGHETTANLLAWTFYLLGRNPQAETELIAEIDRVLAGRTVTVADLPNLPYTEMVLKEAMRLYPPAWIIARQAIQDVQLGDYQVPKGSSVVISPYVSHHDARWFPAPEKFDPMRFTPENEAKLPRYAYFPFGGGPRICIGNGFAMMEARLVLATVLQAYRAPLVPAHKVEMEPLVTLRPRNGIRVMVAARQPIFE